jgi:hypothetical protein
MSRKDYIAAARIIADIVESSIPNDPDTRTRQERLLGAARRAAAAEVARHLADLFKLDNSNFDRQRFYFACALDDNGRDPNSEVN